MSDDNSNSHPESDDTTIGISKKMAIGLSFVMVLSLVAIGGAVYMSTEDPEPDTRFTIKVENETATVVHVEGESVNGDRVTVLGVENGDTAFDGQTVEWGEQESFNVTAYPIRVLYESDNGANYTLAVYR